VHGTHGRVLLVLLHQLLVQRDDDVVGNQVELLQGVDEVLLLDAGLLAGLVDGYLRDAGIRLLLCLLA